VSKKLTGPVLKTGGLKEGCFSVAVSAICGTNVPGACAVGFGENMFVAEDVWLSNLLGEAGRVGLGLGAWPSLEGLSSMFLNMFEVLDPPLVPFNLGVLVCRI